MRIRSALPIALLGISLTACIEWRPQSLPMGPQPTEIRGRVRVRRTDGATLSLIGVEVRGDSLYGNHERAVMDPPVALALSDVAYVEAQRPSTSLNVLFTLAFVAALGRFALLPLLIPAD